MWITNYHSFVINISVSDSYLLVFVFEVPKSIEINQRSCFYRCHFLDCILLALFVKTVNILVSNFLVKALKAKLCCFSLSYFHQFPFLQLLFRRIFHSVLVNLELVLIQKYVFVACCPRKCHLCDNHFFV